MFLIETPYIVLEHTKNKRGGIILVILYSKPKCGPCKLVKNYLDSKGIEVEVRDIYKDDKNMKEVQELGFTGVPVVVADGIETHIGFNPSELDKIKV